ncbi:hypothetical protein CHL67_10120 [Prosthecochloris sp. GSB1]|uniref:YukJ family protein n=1 Tax=Prosthecochloris sp. GSB1 TaxID=281093 RepID=UPI000B8C8420|nr:YukJ family protein [Prosthecochloris sp. GSB1]ASQ91219.1 hypothetical protein CHL67_10120 [Prosthecochloris sp. GSB1]
MPLIDGYGVLVGTLEGYECDDGHDENEYYHCNIQVRSPMGVYRCAIDLDSKKQKDGLHWRVVDLGESLMRGLILLDSGWHFLDSTPESGALDYLRSPELQPTGACVETSEKPREGGGQCFPWRYGTSMDAFSDLAGVLDGSARLLVFGEPFRFGRGVHNVHQNQGDPRGSRWSRENGIWQDGAVAGIGEDGKAKVFLNRFKTQATHTDDRGRPL